MVRHPEDRSIQHFDLCTNEHITYMYELKSTDLTLQTAFKSSVRICKMYLLYDYYCMSNLIGLFMGNTLPYCTESYCTLFNWHLQEARALHVLA